MNLTNHLKFNGYQAQGLVIETLGTDPSPAIGQIWINTAGGTGNWILKWNDNGTIRTIPHLAQVLALRLDQFAAPTADLNLNSRKITSLADPVSAQDAATMAWVQNLFNGTDWKQSVRVATTANLAALSGLLTVDGVTLVAGDRVLVKDQTTGSANGFYVVASGAWTRSLDADSSSEVTPNAAVFVEEGTVNADTQWRLTTNAPITLGTTSLVFAQIGGGGVTYTQGTGIIISGSTVSIDTAVVVRKYAADYGDGAATSFNIDHNLGTLDVTVSCRLKSTGEQVLVDNVASTTNRVVLTHAVAPALNAYRVTVHA